MSATNGPFDPASYDPAELGELPSTTMVFDKPQINLDDHQLRQEGYMVVDECPSHPVTSFGIPSGKMLIRKEGRYSLVDELTKE